MEVMEVNTSCSPVSTRSHFVGNGWNWSYPAIAKVAGTAGNLEKWVTGYEDLWQDINDPSKVERSFRWGFPESKETAWEWFDSQSS